MIELELSVMGRSAEYADCLRSLLDAFEKQEGIRVHTKYMDWATGQSELTRTALYHHGPDVSEIGTTWVGDLIGMNALRPYTQAEIYQIARPDEFIPSAWKTAQVTGNKQVWAIPWFSEPFLIHYRKDLLARVGVDEAVAFASHQSIDRTLQKLRDAGIPQPCDFPMTPNSFAGLHSLASWVWASGGDFCSDDGRQVLFTEPATLEAIRLFFRQLTYVSPEGREFLKAGTGRFFEGYSGVMFAPPSSYPFTGDPTAEIKQVWGLANFPGAHFVGGSSLVIWKHSLDDTASLQLVRFLTDPAHLSRICETSHTFIPRQNAQFSPNTSQDPVVEFGAASSAHGRTYPPVPMWGMIEHRLVDVIYRIAAAYDMNSSEDIDGLVNRSFDTLARRLNVTLSI